MLNLLIKNIDETVLKKLKALATRNGRVLQDEIRIILQDTANVEFSADEQIARKIKDSLRGRVHTDSAELLREDRGKIKR